ncbi:MAG: ribosome maturation factor RimP [Synergistaceae bacterium]|nr:ribosome maturation factor RimP [Synergistaceae bacterium]
MEDGKKISGLSAKLSEIVEASGVECVGIDVEDARSGKVLRIYIDSPGGVGHEDCEHSSRAVTEYLDSCEEESPWFSGKYFIEVSSPGIERPLFTREHYARFVGRRAKVATKARKKFEGELAGCDPDGIIMRLDDGSEARIVFSDIKRGNLVYAFEKSEKKGEKKGEAARKKTGKGK